MWVAVCLDLSLAAQADTLGEVRRKLEAQIREYVFDAVVGQDHSHAGVLLRRRAPLQDWLKYWGYRRLARLFDRRRDRSACSFRETLPLAPAGC